MAFNPNWTGVYSEIDGALIRTRRGLYPKWTTNEVNYINGLQLDSSQQRLRIRRLFS
jgi:hypothetical protein